ncbi:MAG: hypothetical protein PWP31_609 [Clostridia bacterium]|nr:hypothetical protein [Clostridia bacterium]
MNNHVISGEVDIMFYTSKKLIGMPVVSLADGHQLGRIKRLLIDQQNMVIAAFSIDRKGWFKEQPVIPYNHVKSVGNHAVTVDQANAVVKLSSLPELDALAKHPLPLMGAKVITEEGTILGTVDDFRFDPKNGKIHYLDIKNGILHGAKSLETSLILTCGRDALIASGDAEASLQKPNNLLSKLHDTFNNFNQKFKGAENMSSKVTNKVTKTINHYWNQLPFKQKKEDNPLFEDDNKN